MNELIQAIQENPWWTLWGMCGGPGGFISMTLMLAADAHWALKALCPVMLALPYIARRGD